jgi:methylmalonyl-CoA/ethylmalonyl-CoA epimerase
VTALASDSLTELCALHHLGIVTRADEHDAVVDTLRRLFAADLEDEVEDDPLDVRASWVLVSPALRFEVVSPRSGRPTPITAFLERSGGGLHHVSLGTVEIGRCKHLAMEAGARLVGENDDHGGWAEFFVDPAQVGGALLHWMQPVEPT